MPLVIGLTGGIGSGKTTVSKLFEAHGVDVIDADQLAREVVQPGSPALEQIKSHFGEQLLTGAGELDRAQLRQIVFANSEEREWLERLLHPLIAELMRKRINSSKSDYCILASPLLLETDQHQLVNRVLVIDISEQTQLQRTLSRDGSDEETIKAIIATQLNRKARLAHADDVLDNEQDIDKLGEAINRLHADYCKLAEDFK